MTIPKYDPNKLNAEGKRRFQRNNELLSQFAANDDKTNVGKMATPGILQTLTGSSDTWGIEQIKQKNGNAVNVPCLFDNTRKTCITIDFEPDENNAQHVGATGFNANNKDVVNGYVSAITARMVDSSIWSDFLSERYKYLSLQSQIDKADKRIKKETDRDKLADLENEKVILQHQYEQLELKLIGLIDRVHENFVYDVSTHLKWSTDRKNDTGKNAVFAKTRDIQTFDKSVATLLKSRFQRTHIITREITTPGGGKRKKTVEITEAATNMFKPVDVKSCEQEIEKDGKVTRETVKYIKAIKMDFNALKGFILSNVESIEYPLSICQQTAAQRLATIYCLNMYKNNIFKNGASKFPTVERLLSILLSTDQREAMEAKNPQRIYDALRNWVDSCLKLNIFTDIELRTASKNDLFPAFVSPEAKRMSKQLRNDIENAHFTFTPVHAPFSDNYKEMQVKRILKNQMTLFDNPLFTQH